MKLAKKGNYFIKKRKKEEVMKRVPSEKEWRLNQIVTLFWFRCNLEIILGNMVTWYFYHVNYIYDLYKLKVKNRK